MVSRRVVLAPALRWRKLWFSAAIGAVVVLTIASARLHAAFAEFINPDPQGEDQVREVERFATGLLYSAGHTAGHLVALVIGMGLAVWPQARGAAIRSGAILMFTNAVAAIAPGMLTGEWLVRSAVHHDYFDSTLLWDPRVATLVVLGLLAFPLWALAGVGARRLARATRRPATVLVLMAVAALALDVSMMAGLTILLLT
jgi:hypothetical protein